jgi:predicted ribosomally synthesized peptide with nif11-like leader
MSVKTVKAFFEKVEGDKGLQSKLKVLLAESESQMKAIKVKLTQIAAEAGFHFTPADLAAARKENIEKLSRDELRDRPPGPDPLDCMPDWCIR